MLGGKRTETLQQRSSIGIRIHSHILYPMRQEVQILAILTLLQGILLRKIIQISESKAKIWSFVSGGHDPYHTWILGLGTYMKW